MSYAPKSDTTGCQSLRLRASGPGAGRRPRRSPPRGPAGSGPRGSTQEECLRLRSDGLSYREIALRLGIAYSTAYKRVLRSPPRPRNNRNAEDGERLRNLDFERLDALHEAIWEAALDGDLRAIDRVLR